LSAAASDAGEVRVKATDGRVEVMARAALAMLAGSLGDSATVEACTRR
jgi:hypothetical protein